MNATLTTILLLGFLLLCAGYQLHSTISKTIRDSLAISTIALTLTQPALATDLTQGKAIFTQTCSGCHAGGGNVLPFSAGKNLFPEALQKYGYTDKESIVNLLMKGKGQMMPYGSFMSQKGTEIPARLSPSEMDNVASYVLEQSNLRWKE